MFFCFAGVCHYDPLCRGRLVEWLNRLRNNPPIPAVGPAFVAVEWGQEVFQAVKAQRRLFRELAAKTFPSLPAASLPVLERALAFEADAHLEVFPDTKTLWLDEGRQLDASEEAVADDPARDYLNTYEDFLGLSEKDRGKVTSLELFSEACWRRAEQWHKDPSAYRFERDRAWLQLILARTRQDGWAIIIVGALHLSKDHQKSLRSLLERGGHPCTAQVLDPRWRPEQC
ncbi:MAG: hypothetical protein HYX92_06375 [Chloroflexi bacterium]|nr:hypothetical protein [Chloroflexota bacterium]